MEKCPIHADFAFISDNESAEVANPGDCPFDFPPSLETSELPTVLYLRLDPIISVWTDQIDATLFEPTSQGVAVRSFIVNQPFRILAWPTTACTRYRHVLQGRLNQRRLVRGRRGKLNSQRNTFAASHHHPLRTLSAFGLSDRGAPFFAGAKLPSANVSSQSNRPCSSNSPRNVLQMRSQTPWSSHSCRRRQQVLGDGKTSGRSFQRAPLRRTQRIPSKHRRSDTLLRPPRDDCLGLGKSRSIFCHCSSVSSDLCRAMKRTPFHGSLERKCANGASL